MANPKFPYTTYIDRVVTDENHNIIFGEKPGNVSDEVTHTNQETQISKLKQQITNQQKQLTKQDTQITNQNTQIQKQKDLLTKQETQIDVLNDAVTELQKSNTKQDTQISNQEAIKNRMNKTFDVEINGNTMELYGVSSDTKPTDVKIGTTFMETDTTQAFIYTGVKWVKL